MSNKTSDLNENLLKIIENINKDKDLKKIIEQIFEQSENLDTLRTALILSISKYIKEKEEKAAENKKQQKGSTKKKKIIEKILEIDREVEQFVEGTLEIHGLGKGKKFEIDKIKARKDYKRIIAHFIIYEIYKAMNPRRIAGESKLQNYAHNIIFRGQKKADKLEGGNDAASKKYGAKDVQKAQKSAKKARNTGLSF